MYFCTETSNKNLKTASRTFVERIKNCVEGEISEKNNVRYGRTSRIQYRMNIETDTQIAFNRNIAEFLFYENNERKVFSLYNFLFKNFLLYKRFHFTCS